MAKKHAENCQHLHFLPFLGPLEASKLYKNIFSCTGGSKLRFSGSYVKISRELASGMNILPLQVKMR